MSEKRRTEVRGKERENKWSEEEGRRRDQKRWSSRRSSCLF
jgi:hypothetical protein